MGCPAQVSDWRGPEGLWDACGRHFKELWRTRENLRKLFQMEELSLVEGALLLWCKLVVLKGGVDDCSLIIAAVGMRPRRPSGFSCIPEQVSRSTLVL